MSLPRLSVRFASAFLLACAHFSFLRAGEVVRVDSIPSFDWVLENDSEQASSSPQYSPMSYRGDGETWYESTFFAGDETWLRVGRDWQHPGERSATVRAFIAPRAGDVVVQGRAAKAHVDANTDGVDVE
ncbi:MAG: hypothetical protein IKX88_13395, partial [Thermoguttaceae bacterium]|nr:hypothetical protein [Thermoguttaceae bacterium]